MGDYSKRDIQDAIERTKRSCDEELAALRSELDRVRAERDEAVKRADYATDLLREGHMQTTVDAREWKVKVLHYLLTGEQLRADTNA